MVARRPGDESEKDRVLRLREERRSISFLFGAEEFQEEAPAALASAAREAEKMEEKKAVEKKRKSLCLRNLCQKQRKGSEVWPEEEWRRVEGEWKEEEKEEAAEEADYEKRRRVRPEVTAREA